ncbi:MAG TPA: DUF721 domain-containing protein [Oligoflexia bacterium]|nr:DUF721 domain-containing protein [Oligoflexia bacterium]HMP49627.1 DUF721 domain-containing protein [Oligoflexia bacterium]
MSSSNNKKSSFTSKNALNSTTREKSENTTSATAGQLLEKLVKSKKIKQKADSVSFLHQWSLIVGEEMAKVSRPEKLKTGVLTVRVIDAAFAQELSMNCFSYLEKLANLGFSGTVSEIKFISGNKRDFTNF